MSMRKLTEQTYASFETDKKGNYLVNSENLQKIDIRQLLVIRHRMETNEHCHL